MTVESRLYRIREIADILKQYSGTLPLDSVTKLQTALEELTKGLPTG